jgi:hypothetical protein
VKLHSSKKVGDLSRDGRFFKGPAPRGVRVLFLFREPNLSDLVRLNPFHYFGSMSTLGSSLSNRFSDFLSAITPRFEAKSVREFLRLNWKLLLWFTFLCALALLAGAIQDYHAYQTQWQLILDGKNPWLDFTQINNKNAYGPAFNALVVFYWVHPMLPKLLFIAVWAIAAITLIRDISFKSGADTRDSVLYLLLSLFFLVEQIGFGHFDILVAAAMFFCLRSYTKGHDGRAAGFFSVAITLKFYPLVTLPFLAFDHSRGQSPNQSPQRRFRWRFVLLTFFFIALIFSIAWLIWGNSIWDPFTFAAGREARQLSLFKFLSADDSILKKIGLNIPLSLWKPTLLLAGGFTFLWHLKKRLTPQQACLAALMITFLIYPAGHHQFQAVLFFLVFFVSENSSAALHPAWRRYLQFLGVYTLLFGITDGFLRFGLSWSYNVITPVVFILGIQAWCASLELGPRTEGP